MVTKFDPFADRTSRDIRNTLSSALVSELNHGARRGVDEVASQWLAKVREAPYQAYIHQCQKVYAEVIREIGAANINDTRLQAVVLWNAGLFFEVHELLETVWHPSKGDERRALKGLIQAAGAYVHSRRGNEKAARGLARRARENLRGVTPYLGFIGNLDQLVTGLEDPLAAPPRLIPSTGGGPPVAHQYY